MVVSNSQQKLDVLQASAGEACLWEYGHLISTNPAYSFLGASPDGAVYDPSSAQQPFGFVEIKCPYSHRHASPAEACNMSSFCCEFDATTGHLRLKESYQYYAQVQGQMRVTMVWFCHIYWKRTERSTHTHTLWSRLLAGQTSTKIVFMTIVLLLRLWALCIH